jgi:hypothetical protein
MTYVCSLRDWNIQALVLLHVTRFFCLGNVVGVLGAGRSRNGKKSGDLCETHGDYRGTIIVLLGGKLMYWSDA